MWIKEIQRVDSPCIKSKDNWFGSAFTENYIILQMQESDSSSSESLTSLQNKQKFIH